MAAAYRLVVTPCATRSRELTFDFNRDQVDVGRDEAADVRLPHPSVSKRHLRLERRGDEVVAIDLGSSNGTTLGGAPLVPNEPQPLRDGDVLVVATVFEIRYVAAAPAGAQLATPRLTADIAHQLVEELLATGAAGALADASVGPEFAGEAGPVAGRVLRVPAPDARVVFGRGRGSDWIVVDPDLSRRHFEVRRTWNGVTIADLDSKNGTWLDGQRLPPHQPVPLVDGQRVRAGACELLFVDPAARYLQRLQQLAADEPPPTEPPEGEAGAAPPDGAAEGESAGADGAAAATGREGDAAAVTAPDGSGEGNGDDCAVPAAGPRRAGSIVAMMVLGLLVAAASAALVWLLLS